MKTSDEWPGDRVTSKRAEPRIPSTRIFVFAQGSGEPDPHGSARWDVSPHVDAGDVLLFFTQRRRLSYAAWVISSPVASEFSDRPTVELDETNWLRFRKPASTRDLRRDPTLVNWPVAAGIEPSDGDEPQLVDEPFRTALLRFLEAHSGGFLEWIAQPRYLDDDAIYSRLAPSARDALGRADSLREDLNEDRIHMEHLLAALLGDDSQTVRQLLRKRNLDESEVREILSAGKRAIPKLDGKADLSRLPSLSSHARQALTHSFGTPRPGGSHRIQGRHLLYGALSVNECSRVKLLAEREISREDLELVPRDHVDWVPDAPAETDRLGRRPFAESLALRLKRINGQASTRSFLIHVDGAWGAGKSTLLGFFRDELENHGFVTVSVNAWREQRVSPPWWSLLSALWGRRRRGANVIRRFQVWLQTLADRLRVGWVPFAAAVLVILGLALGAVFLIGPDITIAADRAAAIASITALTVSVVGGAVAATRFLLLGSAKGATVFVRASDNPMQGIALQFNHALRRIGKPVVFFIDDLDRCSESYVVEFLEAIQMFIRDSTTTARSSGSIGLSGPQRDGEPLEKGATTSAVGGPYFVVAADGRWIRTSYEKIYDIFKGTQAHARPLGSLFLDKLFQLTIRLPRITPEAKAAYLAALLGQRRGLNPEQRAHDEAKSEEIDELLADAESEEDTLNALRRIPQLKDPRKRMDLLGKGTIALADERVAAATEHVLQSFVRFLDENPRTITRFVNAYGVLRAQRTLEEEFVETAPLALWTITELRWPALAEYLRANPDSVTQVGTDSPAVDEALRPIFSDHEVNQLLKDEEYGPLTPEWVRQCGGPP